MKVSFGFTLSLLTRWQQLSVHQHILEMHLCMGSTCRCFWTDFIYTSLSSCRRTYIITIPSISSNHEVQFATMMTNDWLYYHDIMVYTEHTCPQATQTHCSYSAQWWWWANSAYARTHAETQPYAHNAFHTVLAFRHTRAVSFFFFFLAHCKKQYRETMSSHGSYPPSGPRLLIAAPPPARSEVSDESISYL